MRTFLTIMLAEIGWLFLAASGPDWAFLLGFFGFVLTPAIAVTIQEVSRG